MCVSPSPPLTPCRSSHSPSHHHTTWKRLKLRFVEAREAGVTGVTLNLQSGLAGGPASVGPHQHAWSVMYVSASVTYQRHGSLHIRVANRHGQSQRIYPHRYICLGCWMDRCMQSGEGIGSSRHHSLRNGELSVHRCGGGNNPSNNRMRTILDWNEWLEFKFGHPIVVSCRRGMGGDGESGNGDARQASCDVVLHPHNGRHGDGDSATMLKKDKRHGMGSAGSAGQYVTGHGVRSI